MKNTNTTSNNKFKIDFNINLLKQLIEPSTHVTNFNACDLYKYCYKPIAVTF